MIHDVLVGNDTSPSGLLPSFAGLFSGGDTTLGHGIFAFNTSASCALAGTLHLQAGVLDPDPHLHDGIPSRLSLSSVTHLGDANTSANVIMAKTGHKSLRSVQRYVKPVLAAVHQVTEALSSPRRRG